MPWWHPLRRLGMLKQRGLTPTVWLFGATLFLGSFLLFVTEPIIARMVLPRLGGGPMVWNTCLVFFQAALLLGYTFAHGSTRVLGVRGSAAGYVFLLLLPFFFFPISLATTLHTAHGPVLELLLALSAAVGLPFVVLSMCAPELQRWFSATADPAARDPFFLYAASNFGSLLALLGYPIVIEPLLTVRAQTRLWEGGYAGFLVLVVCCAARIWRTSGSSPRVSRVADHYQRVTAKSRLELLTLSAIPSSLLVGVTTYISTDIAAIPLLWVVPLALYLMTFIVVFGRSTSAWGGEASRRLPLLMTALAVFIAGGFGFSIWLLVPLHLVVFVVAALACHGRLAATRPGPQQLTEFYFWIALGGLVGGLFNVLVAPLVFNGPAEYSLALVCACAVCVLGDANANERRHMGRMDALVPLAIGALGAALVVLGARLGASTRLLAVSFGVPGLLAFSQSRRPLRFALSIGAIFLAGLARPDAYGVTLHAERTFFGVYHVATDPNGRFHALYHGTTLHGLQAIDPADRGTPLTYYHPSGPIGQALTRLPQLAHSPSVAVVGLGIGSLSAYMREDQHWTFYELDPAVERIARNGAYFTHMTLCGTRCRVVIGDARMSLLEAVDDRYNLIVLDAFSSDAIPVHLLTREALALYLSRLSTDGVLAFHVSNRHIALGPVLAGLARSFDLNAVEELHSVTPAEAAAGQSPSDWILMSKGRTDFDSLLAAGDWTRLQGSPISPLWTDDFSNILTALKFR
jgi:hypothetical protein